MGNIFNPDNKFFTFMGHVADLVILNILFIVCCIPIVTIGASFTAMYYVTLKIVRGEEAYIVRSFFKSFKENFKQATIIHVIMLVAGIILFCDLRITVNMTGTLSNVLYCILIAFSLLYAILLLYIYPVLAKFYNSIKNTFNNAFLMSIRHLPYTVLMLVISALPIIPFFVPNAQLQSTTVMLIVLLGFALVACCNSFFFRKIFDHYIPQEEEELSELDQLEADIENSKK